MENRRLIYGALGISLLVGAYFLWKHSEKETALANAVPSPSPNTPAAKPENKPAATVNTSPAPAAKTVSADEALKNGEKGILNKVLIAKNDVGGIYDTTLKKVGTTKAGETLGKAFKANITSNGSYNIKYTDVNNEYRIVNSASVNTLS